MKEWVGGDGSCGPRLSGEHQENGVGCPRQVRGAGFEENAEPDSAMGVGLREGGKGKTDALNTHDTLYLTVPVSAFSK